MRKRSETSFRVSLFLLDEIVVDATRLFGPEFDGNVEENRFAAPAGAVRCKTIDSNVCSVFVRDIFVYLSPLASRGFRRDQASTGVTAGSKGRVRKGGGKRLTIL